tara:strand:+ start:1536 stop:1820 length:285 start_codon:yes stop_codon:yes gene_type:complete
MQELIEVVRVTKNADLAYVDKIKKLIEWQDVISIEEGGREVYEELEQDNVVVITLSYSEIAVQASYNELKSMWLNYKKQSKEEDKKLNNYRNIN